MTGDPRHITWRGALRSCNYSCAYCPFAKREPRSGELKEERGALERFAADLDRSGFEGSVLLAPYGEGMIHTCYQEGYAALSRLPGVLAVSCQTNLSWDAADFLRRMERSGADLSKAALWATMHPAMTTPEEFLDKCRALAPAVKLSVGMVGDPAALPRMHVLKRGLPPGARFWINAMDGLGRRYTWEEIAAFTQLDPLFPLELRRFAADGCCEGRFVNADGAVFRCNRCRRSIASKEWANAVASGDCGGKCDCFLAYSGRKDIPQLLAHGPYPHLRLRGTLPKAVFLDKAACGSGEVKPLRRMCAVYPLSAFPCDEVGRMCRENGWKKDEILIFSAQEPHMRTLRGYPLSVCPPAASPRLREAARFHMRLRQMVGVLLDLAAQDREGSWERTKGSRESGPLP